MITVSHKSMVEAIFRPISESEFAEMTFCGVSHDFDVGRASERWTTGRPLALIFSSSRQNGSKKKAFARSLPSAGYLFYPNSFPLTTASRMGLAWPGLAGHLFGIDFATPAATLDTSSM